MTPRGRSGLRCYRSCLVMPSGVVGYLCYRKGLVMPPAAGQPVSGAIGRSLGIPQRRASRFRCYRVGFRSHSGDHSFTLPSS